MRKGLIVCCLLIAAGIWAAAATSNLYVLEGSLIQTTDYVYRVTLQPDSSRLDCLVSLLDTVDQPWYRVEIHEQSITATPTWSDRYDDTDRNGNRSARLDWYHAPSEVIVERHVRATSEAVYGPIQLSDPFPVSRDTLPWSVRSSALAATDEAQSDDPTILSYVQAITADSRTLLDAVVRVIAWIRREIVYACSAELCDPVYRTDAVFTLGKKKGNCVSYANLALALLRAAGIPSVEAHGFVADRAESNAAHAWIAVYFPSYGWIEFESADWMPAYDEVPITFLMPQHLTIRVGEQSEGVSHAAFYERHEAEFSISQRPEAFTSVAASTKAGEPVAWVMTVTRPSWETARLHLAAEGVPAGWDVTLSESDIQIGENDAHDSVDLLVTVFPPNGVSLGTSVQFSVVCTLQGEEVGRVQFEVTISS